MIDYPEDQLRRGRWLMWMAIAWLLWTSLYDLSMLVDGAHTGRPYSVAIRIGLTLFLCYKLYRGKNWARITIGVLYGLGGIYGLVVLGGVMFGRLQSLASLIFVFFQLLICASNAWALLFSKSLRQYLHFRRLDRAITPDRDVSELVEQIERRRQRDDLSSREGP